MEPTSSAVSGSGQETPRSLHDVEEEIRGVQGSLRKNKRRRNARQDADRQSLARLERERDDLLHVEAHALRRDTDDAVAAAQRISDLQLADLHRDLRSARDQGAKEFRADTEEYQHAQARGVFEILGSDKYDVFALKMNAGVVDEKEDLRLRNVPRGRRTNLPFARWPRASTIKAEIAAEKFDALRHHSQGSEPQKYAARESKMPLILPPERTGRFCVCEQFHAKRLCEYGLCRRCCDGAAIAAKLSGSEIPACVAHRPHGVVTSLAAFSMKNCMSCSVSIRAHMAQMLEDHSEKLDQTLPIYSLNGDVHRFGLLFWQDGFSTLGPHLWASVTSLYDDNRLLMPQASPRALREMSFLQLQMVDAGARFEDLCGTMVPVIKHLVAACLYPVMHNGRAFAADPRIALGDEQQLQFWCGLHNSSHKCCPSCTQRRSEWACGLAYSSARSTAADGCLSFALKTIRLLKQKGSTMTAAERNSCDGVGQRPLWLCYNWRKVATSELEGAEAGAAYPPGFVFDPDQAQASLWVERAGCEPEYPDLCLTELEHQVWEWILCQLEYMHDEMHVGSGNADHLRDIMLSSAKWNNTKADGAVIAEALYCAAGKKKTPRQGWSCGDKQQATATLYAPPWMRAHVAVDITDVLPHIILHVGRRVKEMQHFFNLNEASSPSITGWSNQDAITVTIAGCLNMLILHVLVSVLWPGDGNWASKLHLHALLHMIQQFLTKISHSCQHYERHFSQLKPIGSVNPHTALEEISWFMTHGAGKHRALTHHKNYRSMERHRRHLHHVEHPWIAPIFPVALAKLDCCPWGSFLAMCGPAMAAAELEWVVHGSAMYLACAGTTNRDYVSIHDDAQAPDAHEQIGSFEPAYGLVWMQMVSERAAVSMHDAQEVLGMYPPQASCVDANFNQGSAMTPHAAASAMLSLCPSTFNWPAPPTKKGGVRANRENFAAAANYACQLSTELEAVHMHNAETRASYAQLSQKGRNLSRATGTTISSNGLQVLMKDWFTLYTSLTKPEKCTGDVELDSDNSDFGSSDDDEAM